MCGIFSAFQPASAALADLPFLKPGEFVS